MAGLSEILTGSVPEQMAPLDLTEWQRTAGVGDTSSVTSTQCDCNVAKPVNTKSGDLYDTATDINVPGRGLNLNVTRSYNSMLRSPSSSEPLYGVSCDSSTDCWAVGTYVDSTGAWYSLTEHFDGSQWTMDSSGSVLHAAPAGVDCVSSTDCWTVGFIQGPRAFAEHYDGTSWGQVSIPTPGPNDEGFLTSVSCVSASNCWAVGNYVPTGGGELPFSEQWNGTAWTVVTVPAGNTSTAAINYLGSVSCANASLCWAVGYYFNTSGQQVALVDEYNGSTWSLGSALSQTTGVYLSSVSCPSTSLCVAAGYAGSSLVALSWSGATWSDDSAPTPSNSNSSNLTSTSCVSTTFCQAVGYQWSAATNSYLTVVEQYNGSTWTLGMSPNGSQRDYNELEGVSCPTSTSCISVGFVGPATNYYPQPLAEAWDGNSWGFTAGAPFVPSSPVIGPFGYGWTSPLTMNLQLQTNAGRVILDDGTGTSVAFEAALVNGVLTWVAPGYSATTLVHNSNGTWTYAKWDGASYTFNSSGQLTSASDRNGNTTTFSYNGSGQLSTMTDASGRTLTFTWTGSNITKITDPDSQSVSYTYDSNGNLSMVTNQDGKTTTYTYDSSHDLLTATDPNGNVAETNTFDSTGRVLTQKDALGGETTFVYTNPAPNVTTTLVTDPNGNETLYTFNYGLLAQKFTGYGSALSSATSYLYDPITLAMTQALDPNGNVTTYTHDANGNLLTQTDPLGNEEQYTYNSLNEVLTATDPLGVMTTNTYDANGNLLTTSKPLLNSSGQTIATATTTYTYSDSSNPGLPTSINDPNGHTTTYAYDTYGNDTSITDALGDETTFTYDILGRRLTSVAPDGNVSGGTPSHYTTTYTYNPYNEVLTTTDPNGNVTTNTYDADGNLVTVTQPGGTETVKTYNGNNQPTGVQTKDPSGTVVQTTSTAYDANGNVTSQTDGNGHTTTYSFNALNQQISSTNALSETTSYVYDGLGNLLTETSPSGVTTTNTYNGANELTGMSYSDGTHSVSYTYDADGRKTGMTDETGTSSWTYDSLGRLTSYTNGAGTTVSYGYDIAGNQTSITYPGSNTVGQAYNSGNEMTSLTDWNSKTADFTYDASGNLTKETLPNGVTDTYTFDPANNLIAISDMNGSTTIFAANYMLNSNNLITTDSSQPSSAQNYQYTALNQVCYAGTSNSSACTSPPSGALAYAYDAAGNLTTKHGATQTYNAGDELCWAISGASTNGCSTAPAGATTYTYDANGNRTAATPSSGSPSSYTYNGVNELTQYQLGSGTATSYAYDGDGLRQSKTTGSTTTAYLWDESARLALLLQETTGSSTTDYLYGPTGTPLEEILPSGSTYYYAHDSLGSTRALTDSSGVVANTDSYDPYGNLASSTGSVANPLLYAGQYLDSESGLYYMRARYYDPLAAQFLTVDPMVQRTSQPYSYANGDPINAMDPSGLICGLDLFQNCDPACPKSVQPLGPWQCTAAMGAVYEGTHNVVGLCTSGSSGAAVGAVSTVCIAGNLSGVATTLTAGGGVDFPPSADVAFGPLFAPGISSVNDLGGWFSYTGASVGAGTTGGAETGWGCDSQGQMVRYYFMGSGDGLQYESPVAIWAGFSYTDVYDWK